MSALYFDCFSGISGDMTLGALLDLGIDEALFRKELDKLDLKGYRIEVKKKSINGIYGTDIEVILQDEHDNASGHSHVHTGGHEHEQGHEHKQGHEHSHTARNLYDIEHLIDHSRLAQKVKDFSKKVFREIAVAEAKVHNKAIDEVHFHEVGAIDSIVDIVGVAICLDMLGIDKVYSSALHDGKGFIKCQHGMIPVPVPAVMEMLAGSKIPLITTDVDTELVTPTGMGIIKCLASEFGNMPAMSIQKIGYGMGKRETGKLNALRIVTGNLIEKMNPNDDEILILQTNIDDMSPEILGYTMEKLIQNGALDVFYIPIYMKKNRPGILLTVFAKVADENKFVDIIFRETTTLGVRISTTRRYCLERVFDSVQTEYGTVKIKRAFYDDMKKVSPEYEDCRKIAVDKGIPLKDVYNMVNDAIVKLRF